MCHFVLSELIVLPMSASMISWGEKNRTGDSHSEEFHESFLWEEQQSLQPNHKGCIAEQD